MPRRTRILVALFGTVAGGLWLSRYTSRKESYVPSKRVPTKEIPDREEQLRRLKNAGELDLLVVGGGATGCGIVLDAATRGLKVALVEEDDFSAGTSSRSTKLIHGGVRYLEKAFWNLDYEQYSMVSEALHERKNLLKIAPHLSYELPIMLPIYTWWQVPYFYVGAKVYDKLAGKEALESSYLLTKSKALEVFPMLKKDALKGAVVYYDGAHNDSRMNVVMGLTAAAEGAIVTNHTQVVNLIKTKTPDGQEKICGATIKDVLTGEEWQVKAKGVINATGPFTDTLRKMDDPNIPEIVTPSAGVHVVLPDYYSPQTMGLIDPATSDGRVIFFLPWQGSTIAGTTDSPTSLSKLPQPLENEIDFILQEIKRYLDKDIQVRRGDVLAAWSGIRPLIRDPAAVNTESLSRSHLVHCSKSGLLTVAGGKWTTYRKMALDAVDEAIKVFDLKPKGPSLTERTLLVGAHDYTPGMFIQLIQKYGIDTQVAQHLSKSYGDRAPEVIQLSKLTGKRWPVMGTRLIEGYPYIDAEIKYALRHEYACTIIDVIARRLRIAFLNADAAMDIVPRVADIMAKELNWSDERKKEELRAAHQFLLTMGLEDTESRSKFNVNDLVRFRRAFSEVDADKDGRLTKEQLGSALNLLQINHTNQDLASFVERFDKNKNGVIEFNEFMEVMLIYKQAQQQEQRSNVVMDFNTERSGGGV